jgi:ATP-binding cassette, subfamily B, multidrug efflux pump
MSAEEDPKEAAWNRALVSRVLAFARPYRARFLFSVLLLFTTSIVGLAAPLIVRDAIRSFLPPGVADLVAESPSAFKTAYEGLLLAGGALAALAAFAFYVRRAQLLIVNETGQRAIHDLRMRVFRHVTTRSLRFFDRTPTGRLVTRVTNDVEALNELFISGIDVMFYDVLRIALIAGVLFAVDPTMALATLAVVPFLALWSRRFQNEARKLYRKVRGEIAALNTKMTESLAGVRVVHAFRREKATADAFDTGNEKLRDAHVATVRNYALFYPGMEILTALGTGAIVVTGDALLLKGAVAREDLVLFWLLFNMFVEPLRGLADKFNVLQAALAAGERIFRLLDDDRTLPIKEDARTLDVSRGDVRFENVSFSYEEERRVLHDVSFHVKPGETYAFVGPTGSGKSTIIGLLLRFYDPDKGAVRLDGVDVRDLRPESLRRRVGVVLQDVFLFAGTLRENLALDDPTLDDATLTSALDAVGAGALCERIGGLDGEILERGAGLSTGEKQLLAFARTLAHDPAVLVLDEATANIDTESERVIQDALARLMEGRTTLVVAHRLSTIRRATRILVVHHGRIREQGTHAELLAEGGVYARLHRLQFAT